MGLRGVGEEPWPSALSFWTLIRLPAFSSVLQPREPVSQVVCRDASPRQPALWTFVPVYCLDEAART